MKEQPISKNERSLERYSAVSAIKQHLATGQTLSVALQLCAQQSWAGTYYSASTLEKWYYKYQHSGYDALIDKTRHDKTLRKLPAAAQDALLALRKQHPRQTVTTVLRELEKQNILPAGTYSPSSIYRFLRDHGLDKQSLKNTLALEGQGPTKAFEKPLTNELWMSDAMHGISLKPQGSKTRKTYLFAIIDDHSRLITHAQYYFAEDSAALLDTLKQALLRRGIPQSFYTDNGKPFVSNHLKEVCARLGIRLLHAKPYAAYSKGKIDVAQQCGDGASPEGVRKMGAHWAI